MSIGSVPGRKADVSGSQSDSSYYAIRTAIHHGRISTRRTEFSYIERIRQRTRVLRRCIQLLPIVLGYQTVIPLIITNFSPNLLTTSHLAMFFIVNEELSDDDLFTKSDCSRKNNWTLLCYLLCSNSKVPVLVNYFGEIIIFNTAAAHVHI